MPEVVIVGGGPAGSSLATLLARAGVDTLLLDGARFPRPKPCGEALNPGAVAALRRLGAAPAGAPLRGWRIAGGGAAFTGCYPAPHRGQGCSRLALDDRLLAQAGAAGARVEQGVRVVGLNWDGGRVAGVWVGKPDRPLRVGAQVVVGADGLRSTVARGLGLHALGPLRKVAFTTSVHAVEWTDLGAIHLAPGLTVGLAPLEAGRANLTLVVPATVAQQTGGDRRGFLHAQLQRIPALAPLVITEPILTCGPFDRPVRRRAVPGAVLVGDAAGYYDPLTGQGIYRALRGAELAAAAVLTHLQTGSHDELAQYDRRLRQEFAPGTWLQRLVEYTLLRPRLLRSALHLLNQSPGLATWFMARIGDCPAGWSCTN